MKKKTQINCLTLNLKRTNWPQIHFDGPLGALTLFFLTSFAANSFLLSLLTKNNTKLAIH